MRRSAAFLLTAALLLPTGRVLADGAPPGSATALDREQAQSRFVRAKELFDARDFAGALAAFRASLEIVNSPNARLYVGRALRELDQPLEAYVELGRTAVEAREATRIDGRYALTATEASEERDALVPQLAFLTLVVPGADASTLVRIGGKHEVKQASWGDPVPALPGVTELVVESSGRAPSRKTVTLVAGERITLELALGATSPSVAGVSTSPQPSTERPATRTNKLRPAAYVAGGIGLVGLATFVVAGTLARSSYDSLDAECAGGPCPEARRSDISSGIAKQTVANVGLVVGAVGLAAGVTLFVVSSPSKSGVPATTRRLTPGGLSLGGAL